MMGSNRLSGKSAIVTAAGAGIGRAIAEAFAAEGAMVHALDINDAALSDLKSDNIEIAKVDATDGAVVTDYVRTRGPFDILVNAVGWVHHGTILECTPEDWSKSFALNVDTMFHTIRAVLPGMQQNSGGSIINIASAASSLKGFPNRAAYGTSKGATIALTKSVAVDFISEGIRCNAICPGTVDSPSLKERIAELGKTMGGTNAARAAFVARQPMGRLGTPEEIASMAVYLGSDESAYSTGQAYVIDGGILA